MPSHARLNQNWCHAVASTVSDWSSTILLRTSLPTTDRARRLRPRSLSGGLFAGKVASVEDQAPEGGRFDPTSNMGKMYRARYLREGYFEALELLKNVVVRSFSIASGRKRWLPNRKSVIVVLLGKTQLAPYRNRSQVVPISFHT